ncbi:hypothetical protein EDB85DRAFT_2152825 [Lactarius pseudohatsudake]|nr:hypothetical protein EDB85DRAFT_2152825 [Lactarius pseudohatsudake]
MSQNHVCRRCLATRKSTTTPLHESPAPPQRHAVATRKTRHHANPLPASPVVTPPNHGAQDPATANTRASPHGRLRPDDFDTATTKATTAGADGSKDNDDDIDNTDDTRPATTMVTNALTMSWALARGSKPRKSPPLPPHHTSTPHRPFTSPPTPPPRHGAQDSPRPHAIATCKTHHDANPPRRHPPTPRKIRYNANPLPASPAVRHHASRKPRRDANVALRTLPPVTRLNGTQDHASALRNSLTVMPPLTVGMQRASPTADDEDDGSEDNSNDTDNTTPNDTDTDAGNNDTRGPRGKKLTLQMNYALNYVRSGHWSGSELKQDPGARLPDLKVSIIPSILPTNDLAIDPFHPVSAASPASCDDGVLAQTRRSRLFRRHGDVPSAASEQASERRRSSHSSSTSTGSPPYFSCLMRTTRLGAATDRSKRACAGARRRTSGPGGFMFALNKIARACARGADEADEYLTAYRQSKHRTLMLIYKRMNDAPATLLPRRSLEFHTRTGLTSRRSVRHLACVQLPTFSHPFLLTGSVEDSSTETAQVDTCLPVFGLKKGRQTEGRVRAAGIAGDALPAAAPASASASTFATAPTSSPVLPARSNLVAAWAAA